jgi:hypothetical protein
MPAFAPRYEFKYIVDHRTVDDIRQIVRSLCEPDSYGENGRYEVNSLYFDTFDWLSAHQTIGGIRDRFKLRIRTYGWQDTDPVFLEIKGRAGTTILKRRALMDRRFVHAICTGEPPPDGGFVALKASHQEDLDLYRNQMDALDMRPRVWVRYIREAYGSPWGDGARLTFDSCLEGQISDPVTPYVPDHAQWAPVRWEAGPVMIEMKFNGAFPKWMLHLVRQFGLTRMSSSKYVLCALRLGHLPWAGTERGLQWTAM